MRSVSYGLWSAHFHGDLSGSVEFQNGATKVEVPAQLVKAVIADWVRSERIAAIEMAPDSKILLH